MQAVRPVLRRRAPALLRSGLLRRAQHGHTHKEYFQNPGQTPLPDTSAYAQPVAFPQGVIAPPVVPEPSRTIRALRSVFWACLFSVVGVVAGTGLITWEYMQPPFEPGSPEEEELYESIVDMLETHPLVEELRNENWVEEDFYIRRSPVTSTRGFNLVHEKLTGPEGLTIKAFKHPSLNYTILVVFTGFGIEGWPDTVHGGVITSLLLEGASRHVENYYKNYEGSEKQFVNIDFKAPMRPGEIYAVLVPPAGMEDVPGRPEEKVLKMASLLMRMEAAPRLASHFDALSNTETHTIEIPTPNGVDMTHATAKVDFYIVSGSATETGQHESTTQEEP